MPDDSVSRNVASPEEQAAKDETVTEGNLEESSASSCEKEPVYEQRGSIIKGPDIEKLVLQIMTRSTNIPEFTLPEASIETEDSETEYDEDTDPTIELKLNYPESFQEQCAKRGPEALKDIHYFEGIIASKEKKDNILSEASEVDVKLLESKLKDLWKATSPTKTGANIDVVRCRLSEEVNPNEYDEREQRVLSGFERECREWECVSAGKASDLLAETEASYLTLSNKHVRRLKIINPSYNLRSKDYKPQVAIVGNRYRIIIDVSSFNLGNIVVHVVGNRINFYAKGKFDDKNCRTSTDQQKLFKVPEHVNRDEFKAHMLNPLKLLCICAPLKLSVQDQNAASTPMEM